MTDAALWVGDLRERALPAGGEGASPSVTGAVRRRLGASICRLEFLIQRQCRDTAPTVGLADRGVLGPGYRADLNVIERDGLRLRRPEVHHEFPGGGRRLLQRAEGYRHTFVRGVETYRDGELPGRLLRGPQMVAAR